jgi:hypothetical protein
MLPGNVAAKEAETVLPGTAAVAIFAGTAALGATIVILPGAAAVGLELSFFVGQQL